MALHVFNMLCFGALLSKLTIHMPLVMCGSRRPIRMITLSLFRMTSRLREKFAVQSWSHNWPMDNRPVVCISGNMCWVYADSGSDGMSSILVCVDVIKSPLGNITLIPFNVGFKLRSCLTPS